MIMLWIAAALLAAGSAALVMQRAAQAARAAGGPDPALAVYRRQLSEIDDLADRGLMGDEERRAARAETGRRLLAQADAGAAARPAKPVKPVTVMLMAGAPAILAVLIYAMIGQPALPDLPFKARMAQWRAHPEEASPQALGALLAELARQRPTDPEPLMKLASLDMETGDAVGAAHALRRASLAAPNRPEIWAALGEVQIIQAGGQVDAQSEASFRHVLALDPGNAIARYSVGRAKIIRGDAPGGLTDWRAVMGSLAANDPRREGLAADIASVEKTGKPAPLQAPPPPAPAQQADASAMIHQMVDGLASRLKTNPDDPEGWVRLVRAYTVLGETGKRDAALVQARQRYAARPDVLRQLDAALTSPPAN